MRSASLARGRSGLRRAFGSVTLGSVALGLGACSPGAESDGEPAASGEVQTPQRPQLEGRWRPARGASAPDAVDEGELAEKIAALEAIGYAEGTQPAHERWGVTAHAEGQAWAGLNLYVSGHAAEALLIDMQGEVLHTWRGPWAETVAPSWPGAKGAPEKELYRDFWRRAHLFENGDLIAIFEGHAMIKLDAASNLLWSYVARPHHDLYLDERGHVFVLTRKAHLLPRIHATEPILEDFVSELDPDGNELRRVSVLEAFERSAFTAFLEDMPREGDVFHTNSLEPVDARLAERLEGVEVGDVLISCLMLNTIAVLDLETETIVWALKRDFRWQHDPTILDGGNLLLFDNLGGDEPGGKSRVLEIDPTGPTAAPDAGYRWTYEGHPDNPFQSNTCGTAQRLPNGNTLITESDNGRALEVNAQGAIVWEFLNPHRAGANGRFVATLFELRRLPADFPLGWIDG